MLTVNALGQALTMTDRNGTVHSYSYDVVGRQTADAVTTLGSGVNGTVRRLTTAYDTQGNPYLFTAYDASSGGNIVNQVKRDFNGLGQLTSEWQSHSGAVTGSSPRVQYAYSEMPSGANHSRLTSMTYASGYAVNYNYVSGLDSNISRLSSLSDASNTLEAYSYLGLGTVVKRAHSQPGVDLSYIKLSTESVGDAGDQYTGLDRFSRIADQRWINGSNTDVDRYQYGYDRDSNRLFKDNKVISSLSEVYTYDSLNQLASYKLGTLNGTKTDVTGTPATSQSWDYDAVGNWDSITTNSTTQTRSANKQNEITAVSGATTPTYDNNGNLTTDENNYRFVYDAWNKVVQVKNSSNVVVVTYGRDALHRHVTDTVGSTVTDRFFSSDWQLLETKVGSNTVTRNVWSPVYVDGLVLRDRDADGNGSLDERLYALQDANWNTTALINSSGTVQERYTYTPFGQVTFRDGSGSTLSASAKDWVFLHQGGERIAAGDYEFRNRVYSPSLGRWLSNDPLGFNAGDQNWYRYEGNNTSSHLDSFGLIEGEGPSTISIKPIGLKYGLKLSGSISSEVKKRDLDIRPICCPNSNRIGKIITVDIEAKTTIKATVEKAIDLNIISKDWKDLLKQRHPLIGKIISLKDIVTAEVVIRGTGIKDTLIKNKFVINTCELKEEKKHFKNVTELGLDLEAFVSAGINSFLLQLFLKPKITATTIIPIEISGTVSSTGKIDFDTPRVILSQVKAEIEISLQGILDGKFGRPIRKYLHDIFNAN